MLQWGVKDQIDALLLLSPSDCIGTAILSTERLNPLILWRFLLWVVVVGVIRAEW